LLKAALTIKSAVHVRRMLNVGRIRQFQEHFQA